MAIYYHGISNDFPESLDDCLHKFLPYMRDKQLYRIALTLFVYDSINKLPPKSERATGRFLAFPRHLRSNETWRWRDCVRQTFSLPVSLEISIYQEWQQYRLGSFEQTKLTVYGPWCFSLQYAEEKLLTMNHEAMLALWNARNIDAYRVKIDNLES